MWSVQAVEGEPLPPLQEGEALPITEVDLKQVSPVAAASGTQLSSPQPLRALDPLPGYFALASGTTPRAVYSVTAFLGSTLCHSFVPKRCGDMCWCRARHPRQTT